MQSGPALLLPLPKFRDLNQGRGLHPDERDRLMGIGSVKSTSEEDREGDWELTDPGTPRTRVFDDSGNPIDSRPAAVENSKGYGSASLTEILNRMPRFDAPAV